MKEFEGKTVDEAVKKACEELGVEKENLKYEVLAEQKGLFKKYAKIGIYEKDDAISFAEKYLRSVLEAMGLNADVKSEVSEDVIHLNMTAEDDASRIIGRGGETLQALNEVVRDAVFNKFGEHYRLLLNINGYKDQKYEKLMAMAKRIASTVKRTKITAELEPMTSDERRVIHNVLNDDPMLRTVSVGSGSTRHITIQYAGTDKPVEAAPVVNTETPEEESPIDKAFALKEEELSDDKDAAAETVPETKEEKEEETEDKIEAEVNPEEGKTE